MKFDDIIGLLFLLFFIVGPILRGLFRPSEPLIEVELPEVEPVEPAQPPAQQPAPQQAAPAQPTAQPASRPPAATPEPAPAPAARRDAAQRAEGHAAGARSRQRIEEARRDAGEMAASEHRAFAPAAAESSRGARLPVHRKAIVQGMLWHEILSEPASLRHRARRRRKKLLS